MYRTVRYLHFLGLAMFLGSIFSYITISVLAEHASLAGLAFGRDVIETGTNRLTLPGLWLLVLSGLYNGYLRYGLASAFFRVKAVLGVLIVLNAHLVVAPAVLAATELARQALISGGLSSEYASAYRRESIFGGINVILALIAAGIAVWRRRG